MYSLISLRPLAYSTFALLVGSLVGCKPAATPRATQGQASEDSSIQASDSSGRQPSANDLASFVRSTLPPVLELVDLKNDPPVPLPGSGTGSNAWLYNVRLTFAPTEDELGTPPPQAAQAFQSLVDELNGLVTWGEAYAKSPYANIYPGFTINPPEPASPQLLVVLHPKDRPLAPIYGKLAAEWQVVRF